MTDLDENIKMPLNPKSSKFVENEELEYNHSNPELEEYGSISRYNIYIEPDGSVYFKSNFMRVVLRHKLGVIDFYPFNQKTQVSENREKVIGYFYAAVRNFIFAFEHNQFGSEADKSTIIGNETNNIQAKISIRFGMDVLHEDGSYSKEKENIPEKTITRGTIEDVKESLEKINNSSLSTRLLKNFKKDQ